MTTCSYSGFRVILLLLSLGDLGVSLVKILYFSSKFWIFMSWLIVFRLKSKFKGNPKAWFPQEFTHNRSEGCSGYPLDRFIVNNIL